MADIMACRPRLEDLAMSSIESVEAEVKKIRQQDLPRAEGMQLTAENVFRRASSWTRQAAWRVSLLIVMAAVCGLGPVWVQLIAYALLGYATVSTAYCLSSVEEMIGSAERARFAAFFVGQNMAFKHMLVNEIALKKELANVKMCYAFFAGHNKLCDPDAAAHVQEMYGIYPETLLDLISVCAGRYKSVTQHILNVFNNGLVMKVTKGEFVSYNLTNAGHDVLYEYTKRV